MDYNELYQKANDVFTKYRTANMETLFQDSDVYTVKDSLLVSHEKRNSNLENAILTLSFLKDEEKKYELCLNSNIRESILILDDDLILSATTNNIEKYAKMYKDICGVIEAYVCSLDIQ